MNQIRAGMYVVAAILVAFLAGTLLAFAPFNAVTGMAPDWLCAASLTAGMGLVVAWLHIFADAFHWRIWPHADGPRPRLRD